MIANPNNPEQVARIHALLDAFAALAGSKTLFMHESSCACLSYAVWSWANDRKHRIDVGIQSGGVEHWDIRLGPATIHVYPNKHGQLSGADDDVAAEAAKIELEAKRRVEELLARKVTP